MQHCSSLCFYLLSCCDLTTWNLFVQAAAVEALLGSGADVHVAATDDTNSLHFAAQKGHTEAVKLLLAKGEAKTAGLLISRARFAPAACSMQRLLSNGLTYTLILPQVQT